MKGKSIWKKLADAIGGASLESEGITTLELRQSILREVEETYGQHQTAPPNAIEVYLRVPETDRRQLYERAIHEEKPSFSEAVLLRLQRANLKPPAGLKVSVRLVDAWPEGFTFEDADVRRIHVHLGRAPVSTGTAALRVLAGKAEDETHPLSFDQPATIGRGKTHRLVDGTLRVNTVAFLDPAVADGLSEQDVKINEKVSRAHATVVYDPKRQHFRLRWDGGNTVVHIRRGHRLKVSSDAQVIYLQDGDKIELGGAALLGFTRAEA